MPIETTSVAAEDAPVAVSRYLGRTDVRRVFVQDLDGETILQVPGTADPSAGAQQVLDALGEAEGATTTLRVVAETDTPRKGPAGIEGVETAQAPHDGDEPVDLPEAGEQSGRRL